MSVGEYHGNLGSILVGVTLNTYLFGVVSCQYVDYYRNDFKDKLRIKVMVLILCALDAIQTVLMVYICWVFLVDHEPEPLFLIAEQKSLFALIPIGTAITASVTHVFLGIRMLGVSKHRALFALVISMTVAELAGGLAFGIRMWTLKSTNDLASLKPYIIVWLSVQSILDMFVSVFMSIYLHRRRTGHALTDSVINRLIGGCIQTGIFSSIFAICGLVAFVIRPDTMIYAIFLIPIGRTYTTTLMNTLNVRSHLKERLLEDVHPQNAGDVAWPLDGPEAGGETRLSVGIIRGADIPFPMFVRKVSLDEDIETRKPGPTTSLSLTRIDLRPSPSNGQNNFADKSST